ncbi:MAG: guanylate kinase [Methylococcaceae bacterium]|jgi:guanylate kinase
MHNGKLYIISAPSGAGKTSLVKRLVADLDALRVSVSHTTRSSRPGETNGRDYYFISVDEFYAMQAEQAFLEHAQVFDNFYGTAKKTVMDNLACGFDVILEIDWQGAQQVKRIWPDVVSVFILPPSTQVLQERLRGRGQDDEQTIARRMRDAVAEMQHYYEFDFLVVNDVFEEALSQLKSIVIANRLCQQRQQYNLQALLAGLLTGC